MASSVVAAVAAVGSFVTGGAAVGATAAVVGGAVVGAAVGGITAAVSGGNILKGALTGGLVGGLAGGVGSAMGLGAAPVGEGMATAAATAGTTALDAAGSSFMADVVGSGIGSSLVGEGVGSTLAGAAANSATGGLAGTLSNAMWTKAGIDAIGGMAKGYYQGKAAEEADKRAQDARKVSWDSSINPSMPTINKKDIATMTTPDKQSMSYRVFQGNRLDIPAPGAQQQVAQPPQPAMPTIQKAVTA